MYGFWKVCLLFFLEVLKAPELGSMCLSQNTHLRGTPRAEGTGLVGSRSSAPTLLSMSLRGPQTLFLAGKEVGQGPGRLHAPRHQGHPLHRGPQRQNLGLPGRPEDHRSLSSQGATGTRPQTFVWLRDC